MPEQATADALRNFIITTCSWALYQPNAVPAGAILSGFALSIGVSESQVAFLVSLAGFMGAWQLASSYITRRVGNKRRLIVALGLIEVTVASSIILMFFIPEQYRFYGIAACLIGAYILGHTVSPMYQSWISNVLPSDVRGNFFGRQLGSQTMVSMVYLFAAGRWIDHMDKSYSGFFWVFIIGWLGGLAGYAVISRTPYPKIESQPLTAGFAEMVREPLQNRAFRRLCMYLISRLIPMGLAGAFYYVYMINYLDLSYTTIAIYTNIALFCMLLGYMIFGNMAQRYGSKPIMIILAVPVLFVPLLWSLTTTATIFLIPIAFVINGFALAGIFVSTSNLLFKIVPRGEHNSTYFAIWMTVAAVGAATGPFVGGLLRQQLAGQYQLLGVQMTGIQVIFLTASALYVVPIIMATLLIEREATSPRRLLGQFRGNLLAFTYNYALYTVAREDRTRAEAIRGLGRSGTPLALERLLRALGHVSHEVRAEAARGIGEGRFEEAVDPLIAALEDTDSDIRPEAAEALGRIGTRRSTGPLVEALDDPDIRVRASAIQGLGALGTPEAAEALIDTLMGDFEPDLFPTIVDAAAHHDDLRLVKPALEGLKNVSKPVIRLQILNGVGRVLGEKNHFYRIANATKLQR
ncbi:MAG: MFS transporter, partial [Armatimonadota bacterium]